MHKLLSCWLLFGCAALGSSQAFAECCARCGCECCPQKVCRVVCEVKKVPRVCYGCKCEDFCIPCKSTYCGKHTECVPDPCNPCCCIEKCVKDWIPSCGCVFQRAKLTKTVVDEDKVTYKWVVEDLCPACAGQCHESMDNAPPMPPTPEPSQPKKPAASPSNSAQRQSPPSESGEKVATTGAKRYVK